MELGWFSHFKNQQSAKTRGKTHFLDNSSSQLVLLPSILMSWVQPSSCHLLFMYFHPAYTQRSQEAGSNKHSKK